MLMTTPGYWRERIVWYPIPAAHGRHYSRRELLADSCLNVGALLTFLVAESLLATRLSQLPTAIYLSMLLHCVSVVLLLAFSAVYNARAWDTKTLRVTYFLDQLGIKLYQVGSQSTVLLLGGNAAVLACLLAIAICGAVHKAFTALELRPLHIACFACVGFTLPVLTLLGDSEALAVILPARLQLIAVLGFACVAVGMLPFAAVQFEFHTFFWHVFVVASVACSYHVHLGLADPQNWSDAARERWLM